MKKNTAPRLTKDDILAQKIKKQQAEAELRANNEIEGLEIHRASLPNCKCHYKTIDEERAEREEATTEQLRIIKVHLPILLKRLSRIKDPRNPKKCKHKMTVLMIYGILTFVFQMSSRREANREMTRPMFMQNLLLYFPELKDLPHNDTLMRLLAKIEVDNIEAAHVELIRSFIKKKSFGVT